MPFTNNHNNSVHRKRHKTLGVPELIAIALGGMVGGGIFTILGVSVSMIGVYMPFTTKLKALLTHFIKELFLTLSFPPH